MDRDAEKVVQAVGSLGIEQIWPKALIVSHLRWCDRCGSPYFDEHTPGECDLGVVSRITES